MKILAHKAKLPSNIQKGFTLLFAAAVLQVSLGISTLLYLAPTPLAASHQCIYIF
jgi:heme a synthase